jgi:outer membrane protein OmpU
MKKALCATTALVAAGLAAGQASADGGIKLGLSGFYRGSAGILIGGDQTAGSKGGGLGDFGRTSGGFRQEVRINFKGETTLDNGITVAVLVGLNPNGAANTSGRLNRAYADFSGKYGDVRFGQGSPLDAVSQTCVYDPGNVTANFGVNSANQDFTNAGLGRTAGGKGATVGVATFETADATCVTFTGKGTSAAYFSPSFGGFTFGVSYTPEGSVTNESGSQGFGAGTDLKNKLGENILAAGADYNHDFGGGWTLLVGGGGEWAFTGHTSKGASLTHNKPSTYLLGFQVGIPGGWTVGASGQYDVNYANNSSFAATDCGTGGPNGPCGGADGWSGAIGASYTIDAVSVGLEGIYGQYQVHQGAGQTNGHDSIWGISLNGAYALGPGINLEAQVAYSKYNPANGTPSSSNPMKYDAIELDGGFAINF